MLRVCRLTCKMHSPSRVVAGDCQKSIPACRRGSGRETVQCALCCINGATCRFDSPHDTQASSTREPALGALCLLNVGTCQPLKVVWRCRIVSKPASEWLD